MKRIEAFVQSDKTSLVVDAITKAGVKGLTVFSGRGQGRGKRPMVESSRGTTRHVAEYNEIDSIVTVVEDSSVDPVITAIVNAAGTGSKEDGKIFVSTVDDVIDIGSKQKGSIAL
ncbi:MAG TPA: P-II family nitrogen regulator [Nitrosopumilaceae archaeon]|nr:P-II family nitrogen regulator [Nitrosopumilaceae archaeon]